MIGFEQMIGGHFPEYSSLYRGLLLIQLLILPLVGYLAYHDSMYSQASKELSASDIAPQISLIRKAQAFEFVCIIFFILIISNGLLSFFRELSQTMERQDYIDNVIIFLSKFFVALVIISSFFIKKYRDQLATFRYPVNPLTYALCFVFVVVSILGFILSPFAKTSILGVISEFILSGLVLPIIAFWVLSARWIEKRLCS